MWPDAVPTGRKTPSAVNSAACQSPEDMEGSIPSETVTGAAAVLCVEMTKVVEVPAATR